jgi:hypothetical protein
VIKHNIDLSTIELSSGLTYNGSTITGAGTLKVLGNHLLLIDSDVIPSGRVYIEGDYTFIEVSSCTITEVYWLESSENISSEIDKPRVLKCPGSSYCIGVETSLGTSEGFDREFLRINTGLSLVKSDKPFDLFVIDHNGDYKNYCSFGIDWNNFNELLPGVWSMTSTGYKSKGVEFTDFNGLITIKRLVDPYTLKIDSLVIPVTDDNYHTIQIRDGHVYSDLYEGVGSTITLTDETELRNFYRGHIDYYSPPAYSLELKVSPMRDCVGVLSAAGSERVGIIDKLYIQGNTVYRGKKVLKVLEFNLDQPKSVNGLLDVVTNEYIIFISDNSGTYDLNGNYIGDFEVLTTYRTKFREGFIILRRNEVVYKLYIFERKDGHLVYTEDIPLSTVLHYDPVVNDKTVNWQWIEPTLR